MLRIIAAKEYKASQVPLVGEYSLYQYNGEYFFTVGDGCTPIDHLIDLPGHLVIRITETEFSYLKRVSEIFPCEKNWDELTEEEKTFLQEVFKFDASRE